MEGEAMAASHNKDETNSISKNTYLKVNFPAAASFIVFIIGLTIGATLWCANTTSQLESLRKDVDQIQSVLNKMKEHDSKVSIKDLGLPSANP